MLIVRKASLDDVETLFRLINALAEYEHLTGLDEASKQRMKQHGWPSDGASPLFEAWLVETEETAAGYAIIFQTYSTFLARPTLFLEDIFVLQEYRGIGAGQLLMEKLISEANRRGCGRMEWTVLDWNEAAQGFYHRLGAKHLPEWHHYRINLEE